jgi:mRNA-degrading endonuclease toxin of MazEF toxin-antitoxin module
VIVLVDWRIGAVPREPTKIRPSVVVEDHELFPDAYPSTIVVPLTRDEALAYPAFAERIDPAPENGAQSISWALAHHVTSVSLRRVHVTPSRITSEQLESLRRRVGLALGLQQGTSTQT